MKRKFIAGLLSVTAVLSGLTAPVSAYEFPNAFWAMNDGYQAAMASADNNGIIDFGTQSIQLMETQPLNDSTIGVLSSRSYEVANAYERLGDYEKAAEYFKKYIPYGEQLGEEDGVKIAAAKADAFVSTLDLYTLTDEPLAYHWAKLEPKTGVYFGQVSEKTEPRDSMTLIYQEYGDTNTLAWLDKTLSDAEAAGQRAELALNFPGEGNQLGEIIADTTFMPALCAVLAKHQDLPIYLRIGAEMNVWSNMGDPGMFITAFQKVANEARTASPNLATVWSVSHTSPNGIEMNDFYPGDEYVDWVGISCYAVKYFQGQEWDESYNEIYFKAGDGADPCRLVKEVVDKYGAKKPIMLAESGSARYTTTLDRDSSDWAALNMTRMYSMVMMRYPQIKLAAYFNIERPGEAQYFDFAGTSMKQAFDSVTSMPWFIQNGGDSAMTFKQSDGTLTAEGNSLELYALPYVFKDQQPRVDYFVDGIWTGAAVYLPYGTTLDLSGVSDGSHTLEAVVTSNGAEKLRKQYTLTKTGGGAATVSPDGFTDTATLSDTQHEIVKAVSERGIVTGDTGGTFRPNDKITRAEFAVMVCRAFGYEASGSTDFADTAGHWAEPYINACVKAGAIGGYGDGNFGPDDSVTAEQAAKIITVCAGLTDGVGVSYPDGFVSIADAAGMFENVTEQNHAAECTRIDVAAMFYNVG